MPWSPNQREDPYFLGRQGSQYGPYSWEELCRMAEEGNLYADDLLWSPALGAWTAAGSIESLRGLLRPAAVPPRRRWWIPVTVAAGLVLIAGLVFLAVTLLRTASPTLKGHYPKEGPAGSYIILELSGRPRGGMTVRYGDREVSAVGLGERCLGFNIPVDRGSDTIRLFDGEREVGTAEFTVRAPVVTRLHEEKIAPSAQQQVVRSKEGITVTLPGGFLKQTRTLSISRVENAPVAWDDPFRPPEVFDISIEGLEGLDGFVEIGIPYDPATLDQDVPVEANFSPVRWDDKRKRWVDLYYRVDEGTHTVRFLTDHCSLFAVSCLGLAKTAAGVAVIGATVGELAERWANDKYLSRDWKVRILYSDKGLCQIFPDAEWKAAIAPANLYVVDKYDPKYAAAVQDIAHIMEKAHECYIAAGFPDLTQKSFMGLPYRRYIKVKVDSLYSSLHGELAQETFWDTIHLPTEIIKLAFFDPVQAKGGDFEKAFNFFKSGLAHELFHSVQGQYYGTYLAAFLGTEHKWWKEATAEWAGSDLAKVPYRQGWEEDPPGLLTRLGPRFFDHPVNSLGKIAGTTTEVGGLEYEYLAAVFVRYLVRERGYDFKTLVTEVAKEGRGTDPLVRLRKLVKPGPSPGIDDLYADYAAWLLGQAQLPLADFANPSNQSVTARKSEVLSVDEQKVSLRISQKNKPANGHILVFRAKNGSDKLEPKAKPLVVVAESRPKAYGLEVEDGDILYVLAANASEADRAADLAIEQKKLDPKTKAATWEERAGYTLEVKKNGTAAVWALKVSSGALKIEPPKVEDALGYREVEFTVSADGLPKEVKEARLVYDFGDQRKRAKGERKESVSGGSVEFELSYAYEPSPRIKPEDRPVRYVVTVELFHGKKKLGAARAEVTVAQAEVGIQPPRLLVLDLSKGSKETTETFTAVAKPEGKYRFAWDFGDGKTQDDARPPGDPSVVKHTFGGLKAGVQFAPKVRLYSQAGVLLAEDTVAIKAEGGAPGEVDCGWAVDFSSLRKQEDATSVGYVDRSGRRQGPWTTWYDESRKRLQAVGCFKDEKPHGRWTSWYENGTKASEGGFVEGREHGPGVEWHPNGKKKKEYTYAEGKLHGRYTEWYDNGHLYMQGSYEQGMVSGLWTYYKPDGQCDYRKQYRPNKMNSDYVTLPCQ